MLITFHNVAITLDVGTAQESYEDLRDLFDLYDRAHGGGAISWKSDTYSIDGGEPGSTAELCSKDD
jgi:hypothetical protein